jgi:hypothetical protein
MAKKNARDPDAPKRNVSAYLLYQNGLREQFKAINPGMTFGQLAWYAPAMFTELPPSEKEAWTARAEADQARYLHELASYVPPPGFGPRGDAVPSSDDNIKNGRRGKPEKETDAPTRSMDSSTTNMSSSEPETKRAKLSLDVDAHKVLAKRLGDLEKDDLVKIAKVGIESSEAAFNMAKTLVYERESRLLHCVRCHENYDPRHCGDADCVMDEHEEDEGMIRAGRNSSGWDEFAYPCCEKMEDDYGPCFKGHHISDCEAGGGYWNDDNLQDLNEEGDCSECNANGEEEEEEEDEEEEEEEDEE